MIAELGTEIVLRRLFLQLKHLAIDGLWRVVDKCVRRLEIHVLLVVE